ncbi:GNAT family N-acetyltransferase, partial [Aequorivita sp. CIP111184]|uniref:GNAT family N-acetyltransferase n=1 Tax=Aequorivita sp. CIP111184 TaxID=2211356 RepID=UPI0011BF8DB1
MMEIKKILKKDIPYLFENKSIWQSDFLPISKHRLWAHYENPNCADNDVVLLIAYLNDEMVGYMGVFMDKITLDNIEEKIGWLSTWWMHPKTKGKGIGRELLTKMYNLNSGKIGISQFTESAKRVYDRSNYFTTLKKSKGIKAVLRSNLSETIPLIFPSTKPYEDIFNFFDGVMNLFINVKLGISKIIIKNKLRKVTLEYLIKPDTESFALISNQNINNLSHKEISFFQWLKNFYWVQEAPLLSFTNKDRYAFSMYDKRFNIYYIKVCLKETCIGFLVLQIRKNTCKVLFAYYPSNINLDTLCNIIKLQCIEQNI